ncbi:MAG: hypothetical protein ACE5F1_17495 [Planctomycetota bacterium]
MDTRFPLLAACLFGLSAVPTAGGQSRTVVPIQYATVEANNATAWPFGIGNPIRIQYLYDKRLVAPLGMGIREIGIRGEGSTRRPAKFNVDVEIGFGITQTSPWKASKSFAANRGSIYRIVFGRKKVYLPVQPGNKTPQPFLTRFKLDSNFLYAKGLGNFLIEYVVYKQPYGKYLHDTSYFTLPKHTQIGKDCGNATQAVSGGDSFATPPLITYKLRGQPRTIGFHLLGLERLLQPIPLPLGGCNLYQNIVTFLPLQLDATGSATVSYPLTLEMKDFEIYGQFVSWNLGLSALSASASFHSKIAGIDPHTRIYSHSTTTTSGLIQMGLGIVTELVY